ncbi:hypothetical protein ASC89_06605 [Devosia sp. Root413D1]|uniref:RES domain-containing protein n=1 Tax=Devosia sp. Root413D1 TaxID=1736531 RepID=UPI000702258E|nr:RES domain-containing protein [Devosia sp. Root413D1]KQW81482.1 hypothetical protein ASC89_06605 [Devosia sp. Root413D1]
MDCAVNEGDAWEAPARFARASRLNEEGEPLLYTSTRPDVSLAEARVDEGQPAAIFVYRSTRAIRLAQIGAKAAGAELSADQSHKMNILADFLHDEFTREVAPETSHLYRLSQTIAKDHFDWPLQDAWSYPSVVKKPMYNTCFRPPKAHDCLTLLGAWIGTPRGEEGIEIRFVATINRGQFEYHAWGSPGFAEALRVEPLLNPEVPD